LYYKHVVLRQHIW